MPQSEEERKAKARARVARWKAANPERVKAYATSADGKASQKASVAKRAEYYREKQREWEQANRERRREARKARDHANPQPAREKALRHLAKPGVREKVAARAKAAKARPEERERLAINKQNRRARTAGRKLSRGITAKLMELQRGRCAGCACDLRESGHHLDHRVPLALGGEHADHNMQLLCPPCNRRKNAKDPIAWAQQEGRLL